MSSWIDAPRSWIAAVVQPQVARASPPPSAGRSARRSRCTTRPRSRSVMRARVEPRASRATTAAGAGTCIESRTRPLLRALARAAGSGCCGHRPLGERSRTSSDGPDRARTPRRSSTPSSSSSARQRARRAAAAHAATSCRGPRCAPGRPAPAARAGRSRSSSTSPRAAPGPCARRRSRRARCVRPGPQAPRLDREGRVRVDVAADAAAVEEHGRRCGARSRSASSQLKPRGVGGPRKLTR